MEKKNTEKENQHFVPQFYLRYFSINNEEKQIGLYNQKNELYVTSTTIRKQAKKKFFYGKDGIIEDWLGEIENLIAPLLAKIHSEESLPEFETPEHVDLIFFLILLDLRNPIRKKLLEESTQKIKNRLLEKNPENKNSEIYKQIEEYEKTDDGFIRTLVEAKDTIPMCMDLKFKLLKNTTNKSFIISDNPLIKYNQFLEKRKWELASHTGFATIGLQMFLPISSKHMLVVYDSDIYKIGNKKDKIVIIDDEASIDSLNILQFLNCSVNVFFDNNVSENYIYYLKEKADVYKKANETYSEVYSALNEKAKVDENEEIIFIGSSDLKINLSIQKIKMHSKSQRKNLGDNIVPIRPKPAEYRTYKNRREK